MNYSFKPNMRYRMPTHFGPSLGPRQGLDGRRFDCKETPKVKSARATFRAKTARLEKLLPPGFVLREPHTITFYFEYITECEWFAGRGYNTFGVNIPASFSGEEETVHGELVLILWENKPDPIITGRDDLGYSKLYCEIPEPQLLGNEIVCRASWDGFEFACLTLSNLDEIPKDRFDQLPEPPPTDGMLHYKYIPKTGAPGEADAEYAVLEPAEAPNAKLDELKIGGQAQLQIRKGSWEQLPTLVHIVDALAEISLGDCTEAVWVRLHGGKDLSDMRIIR